MAQTQYNDIMNEIYIYMDFEVCKEFKVARSDFI